MSSLETWTEEKCERWGLTCPSATYHENGQLEDKGNYKDGKRDGLWVSYHDNGQLWYERTYKDGKTDGPWVKYKKNGSVLEQGKD